MNKTFIIAEAACTWLHGGLEAAYRSIRAAKECGADAWKTQWTSDPLEMGKRRGMDGEKYRRLAWAKEALHSLKTWCDEVGIEFMCTVFIPQDIPTIAKYVSRFKVSAFEYKDEEFQSKHDGYGKEVIISQNPGSGNHVVIYHDPWRVLHCVSQYPTPPEALGLKKGMGHADGLSDHTTSVLAGAIAVGTGRCEIIEKHVRLSDTPKDDPDWGHSLVVNCSCGKYVPDDCEFHHDCFQAYVDNIREAERML